MKFQITNYKSQINYKFQKCLAFGALDLALVCFLVLGIWSFSNAQTAPEFLVSWQAVNYVPAGYQGKIFPSRNTPIKVGFDLIDKNKIVDLSANDIQWYLDGEMIQYGKGLKSFLFNSGGLEHKIRIVALNYQGAGTRMDHVITISSLKPKVVIAARTPDGILGLGTQILEALPYFFNVSSPDDLSFSWTSNNQPVQGVAQYPQFLTLNLESPGSTPKATELTISATVRNAVDKAEFGNKKISLKIK